ncbi:MAG: matrixin family metalloprotease [Hyphomicrobiaceae bacterium]|nr:matrixin family metalloprotease [Hyphomicrobiaceae bacterium]MCC0009466.1 matrixin family metalloprotease [Hyphomicrobiaceae bacterium]
MGGETIPDREPRRSFAFAAFLFALTGLCSPLSANPITPTGTPLKFRLLRIDQAQARWLPGADGVVTITYALIDSNLDFPNARNCTNMSPITRLTEQAGISRDRLAKQMVLAARLWEHVTNVRFVETSDLTKAKLLIGTQVHPRGRAFTNVELTGADPARPQTIARALICFNPERPWKIGFDGRLNIYDLQYTLAHELGHAIGLDHAGAKGQLMDFRYTEKFSDLQPGDIAGAVALYGTPSRRTFITTNRDTNRDPNIQTQPTTSNALQPLEHFPTKWTPVRRRKCDQTKKRERRSDSIRSQCALALAHKRSTAIAPAHGSRQNE